MSFFKMMLKAIVYPIQCLLMILVYLYKILISSWLPHTCRFYPTCSSYMLIAIKEWGLYGVILGAKRICRCRPGVSGGEDFVPINLKGDLKWIY